nr:glycosyltransferase [Desulfobacterales bacterium]
MRVGFISTFPPIECGIATYTQYLTEALRKKYADVYIVSHKGGAGPQVFPCFDYEDGDLADKAFSMMMRFTPDVVHIQHEFGLFGKNFGVSVIPLIMNFRLTGIPVVTTLHTVYREIPESHGIILHSILLNSNRVIVHEEYQLRTLQEGFGIDLTRKVRVVPHGARELEPVPEAKVRLGLPPDKKMILLIGYFRPSKNFELIVDLFPDILERLPGAILVIAGKTRGKEFIEYRNLLYKRIESSSVRDHIYLIRGQLSQNIFDTIISSADVVVLPYKTTSQSGILAHCLAFGKPVVTSGTEGMKGIMERSGAGLVCMDDSDFVENIVKILSDPGLAQRLCENAETYVKNRISWNIVADKHLKIYSEIMDIPRLKFHVICID